MSNWFRFIAEPMAHMLVLIAQNVPGGAGVAIIIFTLCVKLVLVPLTLKQLRSAKAMQELAPHIQELQKKYKGDKQKLSEETMALYKEHNVNPMAGCFPLIFQLPILYGLYGGLLALGNACATRDAGECVADPLYNPLFTQSFLWLQGLSVPDQLHILPVLCVVTQWIQQRMMMNQKQQDPQQAAMQNMMQFMPLMIGFFSWNLQAGLPLYWAVSTIFSIVQQYFITGWGSLREIPAFGGFGGLLGGPTPPSGSSGNGRQPGTGTSGRNGPSGKAPAPRKPRARGGKR